MVLFLAQASGIRDLSSNSIGIQLYSETFPAALCLLEPVKTVKQADSAPFGQLLLVPA